MKKFLFWTVPIVFILFLLILPKYVENVQATNFQYHDYQISGKIINKEDIQEAIDVVQENLEAVSSNDSIGYANTLIKEAQQDSKKEIDIFFQKFSVQQTILDIKVKKQTKDQIVFAVQQKSVSQKKSDYRNHIAIAIHTLIREDNQWRIAETIMSDTKFI